MLGNLRKLCYVLPLANQVISFLIDVKSCPIEIFCGYEHESLFKIEP